VILDDGSATPLIVNCVEQMSNPNDKAKAVWLADLNGTHVILKCWEPELTEL
jgi:hypothetical protein